jgi:hypothetical protein
MGYLFTFDSPKEEMEDAWHVDAGLSGTEKR